MHGGNVVRITPTISGTAYSAGDVLFLTTEIPNAVSNRGGSSKLVNVTIVNQNDAADDDIGLVFMTNQTNLIGALSPGSSGESAITDDNVEDADILGYVSLDTSTNQIDLGGSRVHTAQVGVASSLPIILKAAAGKRSVYVAGIAIDAADYAAVDDLDLVFHIEYLD